MSDNRPARYIDAEGTVVYRASALGMCDRIFAALDQGYDPLAHPEWFQRVLDEGTEMEDQIREMWEARSGQVVENTQGEVELEVMDGVVIRGHIDGEVVGMSTLFEAKKFRPSTWEKFKRQGVECQPNYPMQTSIYMLGRGLTAMSFVGGLYDPDANEIIDVFDHQYLAPPINLLAIRKRVAKLEGIINSGVHVMEVSCPSTAMYPCPFYYLHDDDSPQPKERPGDDIITPILVEWVRLEAEKAEPAAEVRRIEARMKELKEGVTGWWGAAGLEPGEVTVIKHGDKTYQVKLIDVARKGYTVGATGYQQVKITNPDKAAPKRAAAKKAAAKKAATK